MVWSWWVKCVYHLKKTIPNNPKLKAIQKQCFLLNSYTKRMWFYEPCSKESCVSKLISETKTLLHHRNQKQIAGVVVNGLIHHMEVCRKGNHRLDRYSLEWFQFWQSLQTLQSNLSHQAVGDWPMACGTCLPSMRPSRQGRWNPQSEGGAS